MVQGAVVLGQLAPSDAMTFAAVQALMARASRARPALAKKTRSRVRGRANVHRMKVPLSFCPIYRRAAGDDHRNGRVIVQPRTGVQENSGLLRRGTGDDAPRQPSIFTYLMASGFTGDPTPPVTRSGGALKRNCQTPSAAQSAARASRSNISPSVRP